MFQSLIPPPFMSDFLPEVLISLSHVTLLRNLLYTCTVPSIWKVGRVEKSIYHVSQLLSKKKKAEGLANWKACALWSAI